MWVKFLELTYYGLVEFGVMDQAVLMCTRHNVIDRGENILLDIQLGFVNLNYLNCHFGRPGSYSISTFRASVKALFGIPGGLEG